MGVHAYEVNDERRSPEERALIARWAEQDQAIETARDRQRVLEAEIDVVREASVMTWQEVRPLVLEAVYGCQQWIDDPAPTGLDTDIKISHLGNRYPLPGHWFVGCHPGTGWVMIGCDGPYRANRSGHQHTKLDDTAKRGARRLIGQVFGDRLIEHWIGGGNGGHGFCCRVTSDYEMPPSRGGMGGNTHPYRAAPKVLTRFQRDRVDA